MVLKTRIGIAGRGTYFGERTQGGRLDVHFGRMNHAYGDLHLKQDSNKVWTENRELTVIHRDGVVVEAVGTAENAQASGY